MSVWLARSELEAMERDARYALSYQHHQFQIEVPEDRRQARDAVSQAVQESSESCKKFKVSRIGMEDEWKKMKEEWLMWFARSRGSTIVRLHFFTYLTQWG